MILFDYGGTLLSVVKVHLCVQVFYCYRRKRAIVIDEGQMIFVNIDETKGRTPLASLNRHWHRIITHQKVKQIHYNNTFFIYPGMQTVFCYDKFRERIVNTV